MIIPSIDLQSGKAVQLIGGKEFAVDGGDPMAWAREFGIAGEIGVIDLDAALGTGNNRETIVGILKDHRCRVGGGIRTIEDALFYLDHGALQVIIGTKATPEFCAQLPRERVMAALDTVYGEVVVDGWQTNTKKPIEERIAELRDHVGGFLVTFVEREGRMVTMDMDRCRALKELCGDVPLTVAGGLSTVEEVAELDAMGIDVQVGMALYTRKIDYIDCVLSPIKRRLPDQLWPTVVADQQGRALGLVWSSEESVRLAAKERRGIYYSRSRQEIWRKGETSGAVQELLRIDLDCDRDALRFTVRQAGSGFCHKQTDSCWGDLGGFPALQSTLMARKQDAPVGSYSARLFNEEGLLESKLTEEAQELADATGREHIIAEAADLIYFTTAKLAQNGISLSEVEKELDRRSKKISRRGGDRKA